VDISENDSPQNQITTQPINVKQTSLRQYNLFVRALQSNYRQYDRTGSLPGKGKETGTARYPAAVVYYVGDQGVNHVR
jgi:hypothetical protein